MNNANHFERMNKRSDNMRTFGHKVGNRSGGKARHGGSGIRR